MSRSAFRALGLCLPTLVGLLLCTGPTLAQTAGRVAFEARSNAGEVAAGTTFEVSFVLQNAEGRNFRAPAFTGLRVVSGPSVSFGTTFINGRTMMSTSWSFDLQARQPGTFIIEPASLSVNGRVIRSQPLSIRVTEAPPTGRVNVPPGADQRIFLTAEIEPAQAWLGQQVTYRVKLYSQLDVESFDLLEAPDFQGFYAEEKNRFDARVQQESIQGQLYAVRTMQEIALFPQSTGELTVGTGRYKVGVQRGGPMAPLFGPAPVLLDVEPATVTVRPMPDSLPPGFSGGVGQYEWSVTADRDTVPTGEALTLRISVRGNGSPQRFNLPALTLQAGLETFTPKVVSQESYENGDEYVHDQTVEYVILPSEPGRYRLLPALIYFDPDSNRFVRRTPADSIVFDVIPGPSYGKDVPMPDTTGITAADRPATPWNQLRRHLRFGGDAAPWWLGLVVLPVLILLFLMGRRSMPARVPPPPAPKPVDHVRVARDQLAALQPRAHTDPPRVFYDELLKALHHYLSARLLIPPAQLTKPVVEAYLADRRAPQTITAAILELWETCERLVFAPENAASAGPAEQAWRDTENVVAALERYLGKA